MDINTYLETLGVWVVSTGLRIVLIFFLLALGLKATQLLSEKLIYFVTRRRRTPDSEFSKRAETLKRIIRKTLSAIIVCVGLMMILKQVGIDIGPVLAAAGVAGIAIAFGAQKLVEDVINGFFILMEDQVRVGDVVSLAGKGGLVESVDLRMIVLRDFDGTVHYVRNGQIGGVISNMTKDFSYAVFDVNVAYRENIEEVIHIMKEVDADLRANSKVKDNILAPIEISGLDKFADSSMIIKARIKAKPITQWDIAREFNHRLKKKFDEHNIEMPFPHRTIYFGQDKNGHAPALPVGIQNRGGKA